MKFLLPLALAATLASSASNLHAFDYHNPVRAGDYPDPSVIRVGADYWAAATSSEWAPHFPILHSRDLVNWEVKGHVFPTPPSWARANFWAPEIEEYHGRFFVYYVARNRETNRLAVAVATAEKPEGPYTDHGILVSQPPGSIDPMAFTDTKGTRWLVWKEDGNSKKLPTILWLQQLSDDGLKLLGEPKEIMRNDAPWEGAVVEGPYVLRRGDYFYLFYSGAACCGRECNYALGVARAKDPLGPWEKAPANPILAGNETWRCPGHGSIVADADGRYWLLYHSYARKGFVATGREMMLDEVVFGADGWPTINGGKGPSVTARGPAAARAQADITTYREQFAAMHDLGPGWQWPIGARPAAQIEGGTLTLTAAAESTSVVRSITAASFVAETTLELNKLAQGAFAGLVVFGDRANEINFVTDGKRVQVWSRRKMMRTTVTDVGAQASGAVALRIASVDGNAFRFALKGADGKWTEVGGETDGAFLPPWDRGVRVGLCVAGPKDSRASFDYFAMTPDDAKLFAP